MDASSEPSRKIRSRDPERTRGEILASAVAEFASNGYDGAKIQKIARGAGCNPRLIYHYFGSKDDLYLAALRHIYGEIRTREADLNLDALPPRDALIRLAEFTFDFFDGNGAFVSITRSENLLGGQFVRQVPEITRLSNPLIEKIAEVLARGVATGQVRAGIDPLQLYVSIVALSAHHINAAHTLSATFGVDFMDAGWRRARREHMIHFVAAAITAPDSDR